MALRNLTHQPPFAPLHGLAAWLGILPASLCLSQRAGTNLVAQASQSTTNQTSQTPKPDPTQEERLLIGGIARLSGFDSRWHAPGCQGTQDLGSRGPFLAPFPSLPLPRESDTRDRVCTGYSQDGRLACGALGAGARLFGRLETSRRRIMCGATLDGKHGGF